MISDLGKVLIVVGGLLLVLGVVFVLAGRTSVPIGRLPGDFIWRGKHSAVYFPLMTSLLLSIFLSLLFYLLARLNR